ncbi:hypothetical protein ACOMHN_005894 [Nucella lapillus]
MTGSGGGGGNEAVDWCMLIWYTEAKMEVAEFPKVDEEEEDDDDEMMTTVCLKLDSPRDLEDRQEELQPEPGTGAACECLGRQEEEEERGPGRVLDQSRRQPDVCVSSRWMAQIVPA